MHKLNQKGVVHVILVLLLLGGIAATVWLVTAGPLKLLPKASVSGPIGPTTSFTLSPNLSNVGIGRTVGVKIVVRSDIAAANLFTAKINFNKELLAVEKIDYSNTLIKNWVEQFSDNATGEISLIGGVPAPGFQSSASSAPSPMAVVYFRALKSGIANVSFSAESAIYSNADNINILTSSTSGAGISINVVDSGSTCPEPPKCEPGTELVYGDPEPNNPNRCAQYTCLPKPSPTPRPTATPVPGTGDGNNDGRVNLIDLSVLLTDFNKTGGFRPSIDLNGDGVINTFDFSLMRNLLIQNKIIRG